VPNTWKQKRNGLFSTVYRKHAYHLYLPTFTNNDFIYVSLWAHKPQWRAPPNLGDSSFLGDCSPVKLTAVQLVRIFPPKDSLPLSQKPATSLSLLNHKNSVQKPHTLYFKIYCFTVQPSTTRHCILCFLFKFVEDFFYLSHVPMVLHVQPHLFFGTSKLWRGLYIIRLLVTLFYADAPHILVLKEHGAYFFQPRRRK
jgi:hypothetical protein